MSMLILQAGKTSSIKIPFLALRIANIFAVLPVEKIVIEYFRHRNRGV